MKRKIRFTVTGCLLSLVLARPISGQCEPSQLGLRGFQNISVEPNNPFQAEYATSGNSLLLGGMAPLSSRVHSVARDSQGRVRVDHSAGKYRTKSPDGGQSEVERHIISICDPVSRNSIRLDTVDKTAMFQAPRFHFPLPTGRPAPPGPGHGAPMSFCTRLFASRKGDAQRSN